VGFCLGISAFSLRQGGSAIWRCSRKSQRVSATLNEFMEWSFPMVGWFMTHPDHYTASDRRAISFLAERLFICWCGLKQKSYTHLGPMAQILTGSSRAFT